MEAAPAATIVRDGCEFAESGGDPSTDAVGRVVGRSLLEGRFSRRSPGKVALLSPRMMDKVFGEAALDWKSFAR